LIKGITYFGLPAIDALIVGIETQARYLAKKATWTRKIVLVTDAESPIEIEDWEATVKKMDTLNISLTIMYASLVEVLSLISPLVQRSGLRRPRIPVRGTPQEQYQGLASVKIFGFF
jgi:hypothetical protein